MNYLAENWSFDPFVVVVVLSSFCTNWAWPTSSDDPSPDGADERRNRSFFFYAGLGMLLLAIMSPIDYWASRYFFVHMIEHILIAFFVHGPHCHRSAVDSAGPRSAGWMCAAGRAGRYCSGAGRHRCVSWAGFVTNPWTAVVSFNLVMILWHVPTLFDLAENNQTVHVWLMHASFLVTGVLFWLTIIPSHPFRVKTSPLVADGSHYRNQRGHVRPRHVAIHLQREQLVRRATRTSPASPCRRSPISRSARPSCGSVGTFGPFRPSAMSSNVA